MAAGCAASARRIVELLATKRIAGGCQNNPNPKSGPAEEVVPDCPHCGKPLPLCICDSVTPIKSKVSLLILQHPQEQDRALGTARLTAHAFQGCGRQDRPVLAKPVQGAGTEGR